MTDSDIRLLIVDDEALLRDSMAAILGLQDGIDVVATAASGEEAVAVAARTEIDVALLDLQMPGIDGIETATQIIDLGRDIACLIVTSHGRAGHLKKALAAGISGFVPKSSSAATLTAAVRDVASGRRYIDQDLAVEAISSGESPLSAREADVVELAAEGASIEEIAERAFLAPGTVRNYLSSATAKLGASNRHEAARIAKENGWI